VYLGVGLELLQYCMGPFASDKEKHTAFFMFTGGASGLSSFPYIESFLGEARFSIDSAAIAEVGLKFYVLGVLYWQAWRLHKVTWGAQKDAGEAKSWMEATVSNMRAIGEQLLEPIMLAIIAGITCGIAGYPTTSQSFFGEVVDDLAHACTPAIFLFIGIKVRLPRRSDALTLGLCIYRAGLAFALTSVITWSMNLNGEECLFFLYYTNMSMSFWPYKHMVEVDEFENELIESEKTEEGCLVEENAHPSMSSLSSRQASSINAVKINMDDLHMEEMLHGILSPTSGHLGARVIVPRRGTCNGTEKNTMPHHDLSVPNHPASRSKLSWSSLPNDNVSKPNRPTSRSKLLRSSMSMSDAFENSGADMIINNFSGNIEQEPIFEDIKSSTGLSATSISNAAKYNNESGFSLTNGSAVKYSEADFSFNGSREQQPSYWKRKLPLWLRSRPQFKDLADKAEFLNSRNGTRIVKTFAPDEALAMIPISFFYYYAYQHRHHIHSRGCIGSQRVLGVSSTRFDFDWCGYCSYEPNYRATM
jgi:hypothetical protein